MKLKVNIARFLAAGLLLNNIYFYSDANTLNIGVPNRYETLESKYITVDNSTEGELHEIEIFGDTAQDENNLNDIRSVGDLYTDDKGNPILDKQGREQYKVNLGSKNKSLIDLKEHYKSEMMIIEGRNVIECNDSNKIRYLDIKFKPDTQYTVSFDFMRKDVYGVLTVLFKYSDGTNSYGIRHHLDGWQSHSVTSAKNKSVVSARIYNASNGGHTGYLDLDTFMIEEGASSSSYVKSKCFESTILLPTQLQKIGDIADRLYWDNSKKRYVIEKNINKEPYNLLNSVSPFVEYDDYIIYRFPKLSNMKNSSKVYCNRLSSDYNKIYSIYGDGAYFRIKMPSEINTKELLQDWIDEANTLLWYQLENSELIETNITSKLKIPTYDEKTHIYINSPNGINPTLKVVVDRLPQIAKNSVEEAKINSDTSNISLARMYVNMLSESLYKDQLHEQLNQIFSSDMVLDKKSVTSNTDIYIKSKNTLSMSLNTNSVIFENYSGVEDMEMFNAVELTINSSLPYKINAYLTSEIQNADKSNVIDKSILNIKASSDTNYKAFTDTITPIILLDDQSSGNGILHSVDLKLASNQAHKADVYKTVIKFEAEQK